MYAPDDYVARFDELFGVAYRAAFAVLGDQGDAEDCAQDTLAKALVKWRRVHPHAMPWVARVSTNAAIDRHRRRKRSIMSDPTAIGVSGGIDVIGEAGSVIDPTAARPEPLPSTLTEQRSDLVRALRALPRRQREIVVLRHLAGLTEAETADAMQTSIGNVKSSTHRALSKMRSELGSAWATGDLTPPAGLPVST
ncbi:MAG: sigma-70 family RNA polymerase sigma factor [Actinomycetota bacterium]